MRRKNIGERHTYYLRAMTELSRAADVYGESVSRVTRRDALKDLLEAASRYGNALRALAKLDGQT